jgi:tetratricopeptide (TPR) repeat protein
MMLSRLLRTLVASALAALITACSTYSPPGGQTRPPAQVGKPSPTVTTPAPPPAEQAPAAVVSAHESLLQRAQSASAAGRYGDALGLLERAQRIEPEDANVYLELSRVHRALGNDAVARSTAERGMLYCVGQYQCQALRDLSY